MKHLLTSLIVIVSFYSSTFSQENSPVIDSLIGVIDNTKQDSNRVNALLDYSNRIYQSDPLLDFQLNQRVDSICTYHLERDPSEKEFTFYTNALAIALNAKGIYYQMQGKLDQALSHYTKCIELKEELGDKMGVAGTSINVGLIYKQRGDFTSALDYFYKAITVLEDLNHQRGLSIVLNNIGIIYEEQKDYTKAIEFYDRSLAIKKELGDQAGIASTQINLGGLYNSIGEEDKAMDLFKQSLEVNKELGDERSIANVQTNMGLIYYKNERYKEAKDVLSQALEIAEKHAYKDIVIEVYDLLSYINYKEGKVGLALNYAERALPLAKEVGDLAQIRDVSEHLYELYKALNRNAEALIMHELFVSSKDSLESEANQREVLRQEYKYAYDQRASADSIKAAEEARVKDALLSAEKAENKQRAQQSYFLLGGLGLTLLFGIFMFNRFRLTNKQKNIIATQKEEVDKAYGQLGLKNKEVLDSIVYAKRIQSAILPPDKTFKQLLPQSFVLYLPKDIVAGDFYWINKSEDKVLFAAADCTGHGVPGAMVSVVCNNALNRSVREYGLNTPSKILDKTREIVLHEFEKSEEDVKDGMDIALCSLDGDVLDFAAAYNPLFLIREGDVIEHKGDRFPIGKSAQKNPFTNHQIKLKKEDVIYIFTDGFVDQFGGEHNKKLKKEKFKKLLLEIHSLAMADQKKKLSEYFSTWRGANEQVDDVCVIGVKFS